MEDLKILDNGETEVQIATIGKVVGSDIDGNPIELNFSEDALKKIAEIQTDEILVDADHSSEVGGSTESKGWLSKLKFVPGKGLFGTIRWTDIGKKLIENRVFRWLSPSWLLNEDMTPALMTSCALTNKPSQRGRIDPIINNEPISNENTTEENKDITDMTKEEIIELIKATVAEMKAEEAKVEELEEKEEKTAEVTEKTEEVEQTAVENECAEKTDVKNEEPEVKEEKEEVIAIEALNQAPNAVVLEENPWKKLHGAEFFSYVSKHNL